MLKSERIVKYFEANPDTPYRELARIFNTSRSFVKRVLKKADVYEDRTALPIQLDTVIHKVPTIYKKAKVEIAIADFHVPFHDEQTVSLILDRIRDVSPSIVVICGDLIDFYTISRWKKDPNKLTFDQEIDATREILDRIRDVCPTATKYYIQGNHEERFESYLLTEAPALYGKYLSLQSLLGISDFQYINVKQLVVDTGKPFNINGLYHLHGHELVGSGYSAVYVARKMFNKTFENILFGHYHKVDTFVKRKFNMDVVTSASLGCACQVTAEYMPINDWSQGFAEVFHYDNSFHINNRTIVNNRIY